MNAEKSLYTKSYKRSILFISCLASGLVPFMGSSINLSLPQIARDYHLSSVGQSWILTSYLIASAIFQIPFGRIADLVGRKRIFVYGLLLVTLASFVCVLPYGGAFLIICRVFQGIGCAMIFSTGMAILTTVFEPHERGKAMGINVAVVYLSLALGPSLGGFMMYHWGWRSIFIITSAVSFIAYIGSSIIIKQQWIEAKGERFDLIGSMAFSFALLMLIYGFTILPSMIGFLLLIASMILFWWFIRYEKRITYPVLNVNLFFTNRLFTLSSTASLINYAVTFPISFFMSLYLQEIKGWGIQYAGMILLIQPAIQALLSPIAGRLSDRIPSHILASSGMALIAIALLITGLLITPDSPTAFIVSVLAMFGIGFAAFSSPNTNAIMSSVEKRDYSMASATTGTMRLMGQSFSMGITTMILSLYLGDKMVSATLTDEFMQVMRLVFLLFTLLSIFGIYASTARNIRKAR